jgi:peroxiredoxin
MMGYRTTRLGSLVSGAILTLALALGLSAGDLQAQAVPGHRAPGFTLSDDQGRSHRLTDYRGRVVVLEWVNPSCPFSQRHTRRGSLSSLARQNPEVVFLAIASTAPGHRDHRTAEQLRRHRAEHGMPYPILLDSDGTVGRAYGARYTPHIVVLDERGDVLYRGAIDDDPFGRSERPRSYVAAALDAHRQGRPPEPASTTAYGSSIKYGQ